VKFTPKIVLVNQKNNPYKVTRTGKVVWDMSDRIYLQDYRDKAELTLRQAADRMGVSQTTIHKWEHEQNSPSVRDLIRLATIYSVPVTALFMAPNRPRRPDEVIDSVRALAAVAGIHPLAFILIDGDFTRLDEGEQFTRMVQAFERLSPELREHWLKMGETYPVADGTSK
jgi:transcriptional regulator with XRE-family HTH domain